MISTNLLKNGPAQFATVEPPAIMIISVKTSGTNTGYGQTSGKPTTFQDAPKNHGMLKNSPLLKKLKLFLFGTACIAQMKVSGLMSGPNTVPVGIQKKVTFPKCPLHSDLTSKAPELNKLMVDL